MYDGMNKNDVIKQIEEVAKTYMSYDEQFNNIEKNGIKNIKFLLDNDGSWKRLELKWIYDYFLEKEEFEKVLKIKVIMEKYYIADEDKEKELNIKLKEFFKK